MKKHPHAEIIKAWADGADIEVLTSDNAWIQVNTPSFFINSKYRIKPQKWYPKGGGYFVSESGFVHEDCTDEDECREFGMEFETREAADKAAIAYLRYHRLYKLAEELNEAWEPDWSNYQQTKWAVIAEPQGYGAWQYSDTAPIGLAVFKDEATAKKAIEIIEAGGLD